MKYYKGEVKNPDVILCRDCRTELEKRTKVDDDNLPWHYGTCPKCKIRFAYRYGNLRKLEVQSHDFDPDQPSTWHLADPEECCHYDSEKRQTDPEFFPHYFTFSFLTRRNIYNPLEPQCKRCGISIREIIMDVLPHMTGIR